MELSGKVVIVTGAGREIGRVIAHAAACAGAHVVVADSATALVGIGSGYVMGDPGRAPCRKAKAGVVALTKRVAMAGQGHGIRANVISPIADTRMTAASNMHIGAVPRR